MSRMDTQDLADALIRERESELLAISERRNDSLRELYHLRRLRKAPEEYITMREVKGEEDMELQEFLDRFDLFKHPDSGSSELKWTPSPSPSPKHLMLLSTVETSTAATPEPAIPSSPPLSHPLGEDISMSDAGSAGDSQQSPANYQNAAVTSPEHSPRSRYTTPPQHTLSESDGGSNRAGNLLEETMSPSPSTLPQRELSSLPLSADEREPSPLRPPPSTPMNALAPADAPTPVDAPTVPAAELTPATPSLGTVHTPTTTTVLVSPPTLEVGPQLPSPPLSSEEADVEMPESLHSLQMANSSSESNRPPEVGSSTRAVHDLPPPAFTALPPEAFMFTPRKSDSVTISSALAPLGDEYEFTLPEKVVETPEPSRHTYEPEFAMERAYTLPSLKSLPPEFQRRGKLSKLQKKREKEKERGERAGEGRKEEWLPLGLSKWSAVLHANPVWSQISRATKTVSTRDWAVAFAELRYLRAFDRIEKLKEEGKWSYRQPKKQRGVGGLAKTHWDFLLDEMVWMRTDFREERKWKIVLAYDLSTAVLEWHKAGSREARRDLGIIVDWSKPRQAQEHIDDPEGEVVDIGGPSRGSPALGDPDDGSDDSDDEQENDRQDIVDALAPSQVLEDAMDQVQDSAPNIPASPAPMEFKLEDVEDLLALQDGDDVSTSIDVDSQRPSTSGEASRRDSPHASAALKSASDDPSLALGMEDRDPPARPTVVRSRPNPYVTYRSKIAYSTDLFLNLDTLAEALDATVDATENGADPPSAPPPSDLSDIFPDLQTYNFFDIPAIPVSTNEGRKKSEKRDRDDPSKRTEPTTYTKLTPMASFHRQRPTLLGPLRPSLHWDNGEWSNIDDGPVSIDFDTSGKHIDPVNFGPFDGPRPINDDDTILPTAPSDPVKRTMDNNWSSSDDELLRMLAEKFPKNWGLIADSFNSLCSAISTERRTDWECKERYKLKFRQKPEDSNLPPDLRPAASSSTPRPQVTTRKRLASITANVAPASAGSSGPESRKRRRHHCMFDAMRKANKKRESAAKQNARRPTGVHDTHASLKNIPRLGPAELGRMKLDREAREHHEAERRRQQQQQQQSGELARQQQQQSMVQSRTQMQIPAQGVPQQTNGVAHSAGTQANNVATQLRTQATPQVNISQQQRLTARNIPQSQLQLLQQHAQAQAAQRALAASGIPGTTGGQFSPNYAQRQATSSPANQQTPPHSSATPNPPQHGILQASPPMQPAAIIRPTGPTGNVANYLAVQSLHNLQQFSHQQLEQLRQQGLLPPQPQTGSSSQTGVFLPQS